MTLPHFELPRETVELPGGATIEVRGLSRAEVLRCQELQDKPVEGEIQVLAWATDLPLEEVRRWHSTVPFGVVQALSDVINRLSGIEDDSGKEQSAS